MSDSQKNVWMLDKWYAQSVAGNADYIGARTLYAWGQNEYGELAQNNEGTPTFRSSPVQVGSNNNWNRLGTNGSGGGWFNSLKTDGTIWAWGIGQYGNLGDNGWYNRSSPVQSYGAETNWTSLVTGHRHAAAVNTIGQLYTWGENTFGQLGLNSPGPSSKNDPYLVSGSDWATGEYKLAASAWSCAAIKTDGSLWTWGSDAYGSLGHNDNTKYSSPVQVPGTWNTVFAGGSCMAATTPAGEIYTWGHNADGMLGHNNKTNYSSPKQLPGTTWKQANFGPNAGGFIKTNGTMFMCGNGGQGRLAQNNTTSYSSPRSVSGTTWSRMNGAAGSNWGAIKTDGTLWTWGRGDNGGLGHNNTTNYSSPKQIPGTWIDIAASNYCMAAIKEDAS